MEHLFPKISNNSCGYRLDKIRKLTDIHKIVAGSEGTLGVILSAKLKVFPLPRKLVLIILSYTSILNAVKEVPYLVKLNPSALELVDSNIARHMKIKISKKGCLLFAEFDTNLQNIK